MTTEVSRMNCSTEAAEDGLDLFEMDQTHPDTRARSSSVEFIRDVLKKYSPDGTENEEIT
jgi:hypothetical protein